MEQIRSRKNQYILHLRALAKSADARREAGEYVCDGEKLLREALQFGAEVTSVLWREAAAFSLPDGIAQYAADAELVEYASPLMHSPGPVFTVRHPAMPPAGAAAPGHRARGRAGSRQCRHGHPHGQRPRHGRRGAHRRVRPISTARRPCARRWARSFVSRC